MIVQMLALIVFPGLLALAAANDMLTMSIPNRITAALAIAFVVLAPFAGMSLATMGVHALTGLAMLVFCFCLFSFGYLGGGDAKLLAAVALWFGWEPLPVFIVYTALLGGVMSLMFISVRKMPLPVSLERYPWITRLHSPGEGIPYGLAIAASAFIVYPQTLWMNLA